MIRVRIIVGCLVLLTFGGCGQQREHVDDEVIQQAQDEYDGGVACLQGDSLMEALPHFFEVANSLERLPEDMTDEEMLLVSKAYYQMSNVFCVKMEHNTEIEALRRALDYQKRVGDTTGILRSILSLAQAFEVVEENDSAWFYLDRLMPLLDTVSGDIWNYISAQNLLSSLYYDNNELDSCLVVQSNTIGFKARRGMDTKNDSVNIGINLFFSGRLADAKPYLLKVLEADLGDVERGALMSLLVDIYQAENNADSAALFHAFHTDYVQAESERVSDGMLAVKQYEQFKAKRNARLQALRERKEARKKCFVWGSAVVLFVLAIAVFVAYHRRFKKKATERHEEISRDLQEVRGTLEAKELETLRLKAEAIYNDRLKNTAKRIKKVFTEAYPDALDKLKVAYPDLSENDLDICVLSFFGFRVKEMADILDLRENTVAKYRSNLRKKTGTETIEGLLEPYLS